MKIGIIGAGDVGRTLGKEWAKRGHEIVFGVRNIQSPKVKNLLKIADSNIKVATISEAASFGQAAPAGCTMGSRQRNDRKCRGFIWKDFDSIPLTP